MQQRLNKCLICLICVLTWNSVLPVSASLIAGPHAPTREHCAFVSSGIKFTLRIFIGIIINKLVVDVKLLKQFDYIKLTSNMIFLDLTPKWIIWLKFENFYWILFLLLAILSKMWKIFYSRIVFYLFEIWINLTAYIWYTHLLVRDFIIIFAMAI